MFPCCKVNVNGEWTDTFNLTTKVKVIAWSGCEAIAKESWVGVCRVCLLWVCLCVAYTRISTLVFLNFEWLYWQLMGETQVWHKRSPLTGRNERATQTVFICFCLTLSSSPVALHIASCRVKWGTRLRIQMATRKQRNQAWNVERRGTAEMVEMEKDEKQEVRADRRWRR